jgi:hypothetical protein
MLSSYDGEPSCALLLRVGEEARCSKKTSGGGPLRQRLNKTMPLIHPIGAVAVATFFILRIDTLNRKLLENQWEKV